MSSVNKVQIVGRLGKDAELKTFDGGKMVSNFSVATSEKYKDKDGNKQESTEWHSIAAWGKLAEITSKYAKKGDMIYVEGKLKTRSYETDKGEKRYVTEIVANEVTFLSSANKPAADAATSSADNSEEGEY